MKTKGITIWEKHAEKFVLSLAFVAAGVFTALQFVGEPNAVSTSVGEVAPGEIDGILQTRAEGLLAKLRDDAPAGVELPYPALGFDDLLARRGESLSPADELPPFQIALAPSVVGVGLGKNLELPVPQLTQPDQVAVGQYADALAEGVSDQFPELQKLFEPGEPQDLVFATVRARFDLADLRREFRGEDAPADAAIIPSSWYNDRPEQLVDVIVEREELQEGAWTDRRTIEPIPGRYSLRKELSGELFAALRDEVLGRLSNPDYQFGIIQPAFYPTKGADWSVPEWDDDAAIADIDARIRKLKQDRRQFYAEYDRLVEELEAAGGSLDDEEKDRRGGRDTGGGDSGRRAPPGSGDKRAPPGSGGAGFGGGGPDVGKRGGGGDLPGQENEKLIKGITRQINRIDRKITYVERELKELGIDPDAEEIVSDPYAAIDGDEILVWGHDLTVEPGRTYRYRVTVAVYNPFFGKKRSLVDKQQSLAEVFTLDSEPSEWSSPVRIHPLRRVFITSASSTGGQFGFGRATAEVYRFYDGTQWVEKFYPQPGGTIGGIKEVQHPDGTVLAVDFTTSYFVLDIVEPLETTRRERGGRPDLARGQARVLLRDLDDPRVVEMRDPRLEEQNFERERLREKLPANERRPG